ncbi:MAG: FKBP-type peptidyl-prolyl cis-trans isomerase [Paludibacteraceae bacterium]|nr:FKBP-type peptidyl-prolyl cis-trans isomerase [Paludibacteraceae bacterium]
MMIKKNQIVKLVYDMYVSADEIGKETLLETTTGKHPLVYCHGVGMMLPAFEQALQDKDKDDDFDFRLKASQAYGEYDPEAVLTLDKELFEIDGKFDDKRVYEGAIVPMTTTDGQIVRAQVVEITNEKVTIDLNHPLAGEDLHFIGKIIDIHDGSKEEIDQLLHPQCGGCGGGKCGNGCGDDYQGGCEGNCQNGCGNCCE